MKDDLAELKRRIPLLDYLRRRQWTPSRTLSGREVVGLCPLHPESHPSFYVNPLKNLFFCHGCGSGGDLIRFVQLAERLSFRQAMTHLRQLRSLDSTGLLDEAAAFYRQQLHLPEALAYLRRRGVQDVCVTEQLRIGYATGRNLRRQLVSLGYSLDQLRRIGLITPQGADAFSRRIVFPCIQDGRIINLYGRSTGDACPHRLLPGSKGGFFAWDAVSRYATLILVEGVFDLAVLWQAGFRNSVCSLGAHLTPVQWKQLSNWSGRDVYIVFDQDENQAGQQAARVLAKQLRAASLNVRIVDLPQGHDPNSYFVAGATAFDFRECLRESRLP